MNTTGEPQVSSPLAANAARSLGTGRRWALWGAAVVILTAASPSVAHFRFNPILFHQFQIHKLELQYGTIGWSGLCDLVRSSFTSGCSILRGRSEQVEPSLEDPDAVLDYVFSWVPSRAIVYPTEGFYYFSATIGGTPIMGNFRLAEIHEGRLTMAYFTVAEKIVWRAGLDSSDDLQVSKVSQFEFAVTYGGKTVLFVLPENMAEGPTRHLLHPEEEFVGQIHDESGLRFFLLFNRETDSFYEFLNEERGVADTFESYGEHLLVGRRTGFVFYEDTEYDRKLLVGVPLENVKKNDYFDGPGDQVPFNAHLREKLYRAYPQTMLGDGIDDHGVYLNRTDWMRIAICPYLRYADVSEFKESVAACAEMELKSDLWTALTKEWWNTAMWRAGVYDRLREEGKLVVGTDEIPPRILDAAKLPSKGYPD